VNLCEYMGRNVDADDMGGVACKAYKAMITAYLAVDDRCTVYPETSITHELTGTGRSCQIVAGWMSTTACVPKETLVDSTTGVLTSTTYRPGKHNITVRVDLGIDLHHGSPGGRQIHSVDVRAFIDPFDFVPAPPPPPTAHVGKEESTRSQTGGNPRCSTPPPMSTSAWNALATWEC
jgi:hypothetical protein